MQRLWVHTQRPAPHAHRPPGPQVQWKPSAGHAAAGLQGRLRRALWRSSLEPHAPRALDQAAFTAGSQKQQGQEKSLCKHRRGCQRNR